MVSDGRDGMIGVREVPPGATNRPPPITQNMVGGLFTSYPDPGSVTSTRAKKPPPDATQTPRNPSPVHPALEQFATHGTSVVKPEMKPGIPPSTRVIDPSCSFCVPV
eukprot:3286635-Rhodomonas_salina.1